MAQERGSAEAGPKVTYTVKAGHATAPQVLEVHAAEGDLKPWDLDSKLAVVKGRHTRLDGPDKVTGRAKYTFDLTVPGMLWGRMVRATVPAADIVGIDTSKAEALPGVKAVWTSESRKVRFAGQDVAAVAAVSPEVAEDAEDTPLDLDVIDATGHKAQDAAFDGPQEFVVNHVAVSSCRDSPYEHDWSFARTLHTWPSTTSC